MPTIVEVRVNTINHTTMTSKAGDPLNYVELTGMDNTNSRGFKKKFFSTKKDGTATRNAEIADGLSKDDWVEITMDDSSYANVQTIRKIGQPSNVNEPANGSGGGGNAGGSYGTGGGGGGDKMTKADWALKDRIKELSMARHKALVTAVALVGVVAKPSKATIKAIAKLADSFTSFLVTGDFEGKLEAPVVVEEPVVETPAVVDAPINTEGPTGDVGADDDIPF